MESHYDRDEVLRGYKSSNVRALITRIGFWGFLMMVIVK